MSGTIRTDVALLGQFPTGGAPGNIGPDDAQDLIVSKQHVWQIRRNCTTSQTLAIADLTTCLEMNSASATTVTVPLNATIAIPIGWWCEVYWKGAGSVSVVQAGGVTVRSLYTLVVARQYGKIKLEKIATDEWEMTGAIQPLPLVLAARMEDFNKTLGISLHIAQSTAPYTTAATLLPDLKFCNIRCYRDGATTNAALLDVHQAILTAGQNIKAVLLCGIAQTLVVANELAAIKGMINVFPTNSVMAIDQPNEPDLGIWNGVVTLTIAAPCVVTNANSFVGSEPVVIYTTGALPTGLVSGTTYYVKTPTAPSFNLSATPGGAAITTTGSQSGVHRLSTGGYIYAGSLNTADSVANKSFPGFGPIAQFGAAFYTALKTDPLTSSIPVLSVTNQADDPVDNGLQLLAVPIGYAHCTNLVTATTSTIVGSFTLTFTSTATTPVLSKGLFVYYDALPNARIPAGTTIASFTATTIVMSQAVIGATLAIGSSIRIGSTMAETTINADACNIHAYPMLANQAVFVNTADANPASGGFPNDYINLMNGYVTTPAFYGGYSSGLNIAQAMALPKIITEAGFQVGAPTQFGGLIPAAIQAKSLLTGWFTAWRYNFIAYMIYELYDEGGTTFGLFTAASTPRLSGTYLHNLTTILLDAGSTRAIFTPGALNVLVSGLPAGSGYSQLFQRSDGTYLIALWNEVSNWDNTLAPPAAVAVGTSTVAVTFDRQGTISVFDPTVGTAAISTTTDNAINVSLVDYPIIVSFV